MKKFDSYLLYNAHIIDPLKEEVFKGGLIVKNGRIDAINHSLYEGLPSIENHIDCQNHMLIPGLIDARCHCKEPGEPHKENFASASKAALKGGITTLIQRADTIPAIDNTAMVERMENMARPGKTVRLHCQAALSHKLEGENLTEIGLLKQAGALSFGDGEHPIRSAKLLHRALKYGSAHDAIIMDMPQDSEFITNGVMNGGALSTRLGLAGIPAFAERLQVERDLRLLETVKHGKLHLSLISTRKAIEAIRAAKAQGLDVTCDTAPHYFRLNEHDVIPYKSYSKTMPPLRSEDDRLAVLQALQDGTIDMVVSDHNPQDQDAKRLPFDSAEFGVIGLETLLASLMELTQHGLSMIEAIRLATSHPAQRFGLDLGRMEKGAKADLCLLHPDFSWIQKKETILSKSKNSAFENRQMQGKSLLTIVNGVIAYQDKDFVL